MDVIEFDTMKSSRCQREYECVNDRHVRSTIESYSVCDVDFDYGIVETSVITRIGLPRPNELEYRHSIV